MKDTLKPGVSTTRKLTVDEARTIDFLGEELRVYATPELVRDIEETCLRLIQEHCGPGESSVGIGIQVTHAGATPLGMEVEITGTVTAAEGRKVSFDVVARDAIEEVGRGRHDRFVVEVDKLKQRVAAKVAKARAG